MASGKDTKKETVHIVPHRESNDKIRAEFKKQLGNKYRDDPNKQTILIYRPAGRPADDFEQEVQPELEKYNKIVLIVASGKPSPSFSPPSNKEKIIEVLTLVLDYKSINLEHPETVKCFEQLNVILEPWKVTKQEPWKVTKQRTLKKGRIEEFINESTDPENQNANEDLRSTDLEDIIRRQDRRINDLEGMARRQDRRINDLEDMVRRQNLLITDLEGMVRRQNLWITDLEGQITQTKVQIQDGKLDVIEETGDDKAIQMTNNQEELRNHRPQENYACPKLALPSTPNTSTHEVNQMRQELDINEISVSLPIRDAQRNLNVCDSTTTFHVLNPSQN